MRQLAFVILLLATGLAGAQEPIPPITNSAPEADSTLVNSTAPESTEAEVITQADETQQEVFGQHLFSGDFSTQSFSGFNPDYQVAIGDVIVVNLWGSFELDEPLSLKVDPKGNIFLPKIGPVSVAGVRNDQLNAVVQEAIKRVYQHNVFSYASLDASRPVRVFVTGFVNKPGLYSGLSSDSILYYLDKADGVDTASGSFRDVLVKRGGRQHQSVDLYEFLISGELKYFQFGDGDTIVVGPRKHTAKITGLVHNPYRFEFRQPTLNLTELFRYAYPRPEATHVRIVRNQGVVRNVDHYELNRTTNVIVKDGDELFVTGDKRPGTITVRVEGEHDGQQEYVLDYGSRLGELLNKVIFNELSEPAAVRLVRNSVKERQKAMLATTLRSLETSVLTARSDTAEEAKLRTDEANLIMRFIDRANAAEPRGIVVLSSSADASNVVLEDGDIVQVPAKSNLVTIHGEVLFPNAVVFNNRMEIQDYIEAAGGFTQNANTSQIVILHQDGSFSRAEKRLGHLSASIKPGDEVMVLPKVSSKRFQFSKELARIIYELALAAAVVIRL